MARRARIAVLFTTFIALAITTARAQSLRVMTWNIAHGDFGESAQADFIVAQQPDVVILQEVNSPSQYTVYKALLEQKTSATWDAKYKENCERFGSPDPNAA